MKETVRMVVDRREGSLLVLVADDSERELHLAVGRFPIAVGDVLDVTFEDGEVISVLSLEKERDARAQKNRARLSALFAKGKPPKQ